MNYGLFVQHSFPNKDSIDAGLGKFFAFRNCNHTPVPVFFNNVTVLPDPLLMDRCNVTASANYSITSDLGEPGRIEVSRAAQ